MLRLSYRQPADAADEPDSIPHPSPPDSGERYVILTVERGGKTRPMSMNFRPEEGDIATVAIHAPEIDEALRILGTQGWWGDDLR